MCYCGAWWTKIQYSNTKVTTSRLVLRPFHCNVILVKGWGKRGKNLRILSKNFEKK